MVHVSVEEDGDSPEGDGAPAFRATWGSEAPGDLQGAGVGHDFFLFC